MRVNEYAQRQYVDLEVRIVDDLIHGRLGESERSIALSFLRQRAQSEGIREWAASQEPAVEPENSTTDSFVVAPISWELEPGESVDTSYDELAILDADEPESEIQSLWLDVVEEDLAVHVPAIFEPSPEPEAVAPVVEVDEPEVEQPTPILASAVTPVAPAPEPPTPSVASIDSGPREASVAQNQVFVELSEGDSQTVAPAVTGRLGQLVQCYENALEFDPDARGNVEFEWNIRLGRVNSLAVSDDSLGDEIAVRCMSERIRRWRFQPDVSGQVSWRFAFESNPG